MTDIDKTIEFIRAVLSESDNPPVMRLMLRKELQRLNDEFSRLEELMKEAA